MNWGSLFGREPAQAVELPSIPRTTPLQQQRLKQIESLHSYNKNVIEEKWDKEYSVEFNNGDQFFRLHIKLPPQFPHDKPSVRITPDCSHPWLDERMYIIGCSSLNNFYMHSILGKVIRQVIDDFKANPPKIHLHSKGNSFGDTIFQNDIVTVQSTPTAILISTASTEEDTSPSKTKNPSECVNLEELIESLKDFSFEELEKLSDDTSQLLSYAMNMDIVKDVQNKRKQIVKTNRELAEKNLMFKPELEALQTAIKAKYDDIQKLESQLIEKMTKQVELMQVFDMNQIVTNLRIAISQAEEASEGIAESFLDRNLPVDEFLQKYLQMRKTSHLRRGKEERIRFLNPRY